jgi:hypothetical protein
LPPDRAGAMIAPMASQATPSPQLA